MIFQLSSSLIHIKTIIPNDFQKLPTTEKSLRNHLVWTTHQHLWFLDIKIGRFSTDLGQHNYQTCLILSVGSNDFSFSFLNRHFLIIFKDRHGRLGHDLRWCLYFSNQIIYTDDWYTIEMLLFFSFHPCKKLYRQKIIKGKWEFNVIFFILFFEQGYLIQYARYHIEIFYTYSQGSNRGKGVSDFLFSL